MNDERAKLLEITGLRKYFPVKGKLFEKPATQVEGVSENANYYIFDFSTDGRIEVEVGFDTGIDI